MPMRQETIDPRFEGPPGTVHGGTVVARLAAHVPGASGGVRVRLRRPVPLARALAVEVGDGEASFVDGGEVLAVGTPAAVGEEVPPPPSLQDARAAGAASLWHDPAQHPYPRCFGCGPLAPPDALHLRPGPLGDGRHACTWTPPAGVTADLVLAALDCPSAGPFNDLTDPPGPWVLGTMAGRVDGLPRAGTEHVISVWPVGLDGRRLHTGAALHAPDGSVLAQVSATWVSLAPRTVT